MPCLRLSTLRNYTPGFSGLHEVESKSLFGVQAPAFSAGNWPCARIRYTHNALSGIRMHKRMTITLDESVYEGLYRTVGKRRMSQFIEDLLTPLVLQDKALDDSYKAMAADSEREAEALEWANTLAKDMTDEAR